MGEGSTKEHYSPAKEQDKVESLLTTSMEQVVGDREDYDELEKVLIQEQFFRPVFELYSDLLDQVAYAYTEKQQITEQEKITIEDVLKKAIPLAAEIVLGKSLQSFRNDINWIVKQANLEGDADELLEMVIDEYVDKVDACYTNLEEALEYLKNI